MIFKKALDCGVPWSELGELSPTQIRAILTEKSQDPGTYPLDTYEATIKAMRKALTRGQSW